MICLSARPAAMGRAPERGARLAGGALDFSDLALRLSEARGGFADAARFAGARAAFGFDCGFSRFLAAMSSPT
jgi:hypothetical protein